MFDESVSTVYSSIWTSMNSWFTPTILFVLLNVMIATIAFTSSLANQKQTHPKQQQQQQEDHSQNHPQQQQQPTKLARSPSLLQRIKSINFSNYRSQEHVKDYNFDQHQQQQEETPFEPPTHYIFEPAHEQTTIEPETTQYIFNQENIEKQQTQYEFQQTHQENLQESQTQYLFQHTQETKPKNMDQDFNFNPTHEQKHENMNTHFDFQYIHEQKHGNIDQDFNFNPTHEKKLENMETHFDFQPINEENEDDEEEEGEFKSLDEVYNQLKEHHHVSRSRSDTKPYSGETQVKLPTKMKKSASMKSPFAHFEEEAIVEARRPATTKERTTNEGNEVDAKADDFINKFKQQLKLQRLDSILRYKEMIGRGS